jgi:hypothetical protein
VSSNNTNAQHEGLGMMEASLQEKRGLLGLLELCLGYGAFEPSMRSSCERTRESEGETNLTVEASAGH